MGHAVSYLLAMNLALRIHDQPALLHCVKRSELRKLRHLSSGSTRLLSLRH